MVLLDTIPISDKLIHSCHLHDTNNRYNVSLLSIYYSINRSVKIKQNFITQLQNF